MLNSLKNKFLNFNIQNYYEYIQNDLVILRYWDKSTNFGDFMNPFIVNAILDKPVVSTFKFVNFLRKPELLGMGSIIGGDLSKCIIWGSGIISPKVKIDAKPKNILHVRGKKTQEILKLNGIIAPSLYGDPALLLPNIYTPKKNKSFKLGIIPHYTEINNNLINIIRQGSYDEFTIINPLDPFQDIIEAINKCEYIASSSLHGLIVAEAYNIPTLRLHLSDQLRGGDFKFDDHYSGLNINMHEKYYLENIQILHSAGFYKLFTTKEINTDKEKIIDNLRENFS